MNNYQQSLYRDLLLLTKKNEAFYFQDFQLDKKTYRIFNYRLASYTDFLEPSAIECRGVMFEVQNDEAICLAALPMEKFFNLNENPLTTNLNLSEVVEIEEKADGSLMSTYIHNGELRLKSKGSIFSQQALAAMEWLSKKPDFKKKLTDITNLGFTVNLEWCSPEHRIVLGYTEPSLKILNVRNRYNGEYTYDWKYSNECSMYAVQSVKVDDPAAFVASISSMENIEGYVIRLKSGQRVKIKTNWYLSLHRAKDDINNPRRLFETILDEGIDDLRSMFYTDDHVIKQIDQMQTKIDHIYNHMVSLVENFYNENKHLDRKSYAIKAQQDQSLRYQSISYFGLAMNKYVGKSIDYKDFLKGKWKELGLKDTSVDETQE